MENNTLGDNIARFRKAAGLTQEELGTTVGVSAQAVSRWECGKGRRAGRIPAPRRRRRPRRLHRFPLRPRAWRSD